MAHPKKPLEQHVLDGTYREDRHGPLPKNLEKWVQGEGSAPGLPEKPKDLDPAAAKVWDRVIATAPGRIWPSHAFALERYCDFLVIFRAKAKAVMPEPEKVTVGQLTEMGIASDKLLQLEKELGLTPKAQAGLPVVQVGPKKAQVDTRPADVDGHMSKPKGKVKK